MCTQVESATAAVEAASAAAAAADESTDSAAAAAAASAALITSLKDELDAEALATSDLLLKAEVLVRAATSAGVEGAVNVSAQVGNV